MLEHCAGEKIFNYFDDLAIAAFYVFPFESPRESSDYPCTVLTSHAEALIYFSVDTPSGHYLSKEMISE